MTIEGIPYGKRNHAGRQLLQLLGREVTALTGSGHPRIEARLGHLGGFDVTVATCRVLGATEVTVALDGVPGSEVCLTAAGLAGPDPAGLVIRLENRLTGLESLSARTAGEIGRLRIEAARAGEDIEKPFPQSGRLAAARGRVRRVEGQRKEAAGARQRDGHPVPGGAAARDLANQAGTRNAVGGSVSAGEVDGAGCSMAPGAICGVSRNEPARVPLIPGGSLVPAGTGGQRPPGAVRITRRGFPEQNPLAGSAETQVAAGSRPAERAGRGARPAAGRRPR
jgi:hypothetical protein